MDEPMSSPSSHVIVGALMVIILWSAGSQAEEGDELPVGPRELLQVAGIDESHFSLLVDRAPISETEKEIFLKVLYRVKSFSAMSVATWIRRDVSLSQIAENPDAHRGQMFPLVGRLVQVVPVQLSREVMDRFGFSEYYLCKILAAPGEQTCWIMTSRLPRQLQAKGEIDERVSASGLFMKIGDATEGSDSFVFLTSRLAWHPDRLDEARGVNLGMTILGDLGVDVGLKDDVVQRRRIGAKEREPFYQILWGVERAGADQLERQARLNLDRLAKMWKAESASQAIKLEKLTKALNTDSPSGALRDELLEQIRAAKQRKMIGDQFVQQAENGKFSVFPLFNLPDEQWGRLVILEGTARRAIPINLGSSSLRGKANNDIVARYGLDHYYEIELFTEDSRNNPIVFCVRHLPKGFPQGDAIDEKVRIAGFFFKSWSYYTQRSADIQPDGTLKKHQQLAPLLIGRQAVWVRQAPPARNPYVGVFAGGLFLVAVLGIWLAIWRYGRKDEELYARNVEGRYTVEEGTSLNDLDIEAQKDPDFRFLD